MNENAIGKEVVDSAVQVHRELGPGLLETVYEVVLAQELARRGLRVERQVPVPIHYYKLKMRATIWSGVAGLAGGAYFANNE